MNFRLAKARVRRSPGALKGIGVAVLKRHRNTGYEMLTPKPLAGNGGDVSGSADGSISLQTAEQDLTRTPGTDSRSPNAASIFALQSTGELISP